MQADNHNGLAHGNRYFDITHTFKNGSSTYHVLGLRKDRPTYRNTYYIFQCPDAEHESANDAFGSFPLLKPSTRTNAEPPLLKRRSRTAQHVTTTFTDTRITTSANRQRKTETSQSHPRARSTSPKAAEAAPALTKEVFDRALRAERQMLMASLRREMNNKKKILLRSIKKEKQELLQATIDASNKEDVIRLLQEQNTVLANAYDQFVATTTSSIDTLIDMLESQRNATQTAEQLQLTLVQTIEQEVQKITSKNEEILRSTSTNIDAIGQLQETLVQKIDHSARERNHNDETVLNRLFIEQQQSLTHIVEQRQEQTPSIDQIRETMLDVLSQQRKASSDHGEPPHPQPDDTITDVSLPLPMTSKTIHGQPNTQPNNPSPIKSISKSTADHRLFKVSIRTPEPARLFAKLSIDGIECSRRVHTLCQRDPLQNDLYNCYITPPTKDGIYQLTIYAKTDKETAYRAAICIRIPGSNISQPITFPMVHQAFEEHQCILIEPLRRLLRGNEQVLIQMIVPGALAVRIRNGDENLELDASEYKNDTVKKKIRVRGNVSVTAYWDKKPESTLCVFNMV